MSKAPKPPHYNSESDPSTRQDGSSVRVSAKTLPSEAKPSNLANDNVSHSPLKTENAEHVGGGVLNLPRLGL